MSGGSCVGKSRSSWRQEGRKTRVRLDTKAKAVFMGVFTKRVGIVWVLVLGTALNMFY